MDIGGACACVCVEVSVRCVCCMEVGVRYVSGVYGIYWRHTVPKLTAGGQTPKYEI